MYFLLFYKVSESNNTYCKQNRVIERLLINLYMVYDFFIV